MTKKTIINCFKCNKELEPAFSSVRGPARQPYRATTFYSPGQYGSTIWDPQDRSLSLEILICDECIDGCSNQILVARRTEKVSHEYMFFDLFQEEQKKMRKEIDEAFEDEPQ